MQIIRSGEFHKKKPYLSVRGSMIFGSFLHYCSLSASRDRLKGTCKVIPYNPVAVKVELRGPVFKHDGEFTPGFVALKMGDTFLQTEFEHFFKLFGHLSGHRNPDIPEKSAQSL